MRDEVRWAIVGLAVAGVLAVVVLADRTWQPFIGTGQPVSEDQLRAQLAADGWSDVTINHRGAYLDALGRRNGTVVWATVDSTNGRKMFDDDSGY